MIDDTYYEEKKTANILWGNRFEPESGYIFEGFNPGFKLVNINILICFEVLDEVILVFRYLCTVLMKRLILRVTCTWIG